MLFQRVLSRFSSAHAIGLLALFVALFGTAYAATRINGKSIKNNSIAGKKLKGNTVTGAKVNESTLAGINAAKLGGLTSAAFQPSGAVVGGSRLPTDISQPIFTIPGLGLQIETDASATGTDQVVARNVGGQSILIIFGSGPSDASTLSAVGSTLTLIAGPNEFGGAADSFEVLAVSEQASSVIRCYFPDDANVGFDYCQATTTEG